MPVNADELCRGGMSYPVAIEVARQMNAGSGNVDRLMSAGMSGQQAKELAAQISGASFTSHKLAAASFNSTIAATLKRVSGL